MTNKESQEAGHGRLQSSGSQYRFTPQRVGLPADFRCKESKLWQRSERKKTSNWQKQEAKATR